LDRLTGSRSITAGLRAFVFFVFFVLREANP